MADWKKVEVVLVCTGPYEDKNDWWVENILFMLWKQNFQYSSVRVIRDVVYGGVYDKLRMFEECKDPNKQYIYFDLDLVITGPVDHLLRNDLHVLHAWWRPKFHTDLNSSIMSWQGDYSHIHDHFADDPEYFMLKYRLGMDEFLSNEQFLFKKYEPICSSFPYGGFDTSWPVCLFNQNAERMREGGKWQKFMLFE